MNLGYWEHGFDTPEAGRSLAYEVAAAVDLKSDERLLDVGSGLGQAAIDLARTYNLRSVVGLNVNRRQVRFANALAEREGLANKVRHVVGDACRDLTRFRGQGFRRLIALECINHFSPPGMFLEAARNVVGPSGKIALSLNVAGERPSARAQLLMKTNFGFLPVSSGVWKKRLADAGFVNIQTRDISEFVLNRGLAYALQRIDETPSLTGWSRLQRMYLKWQLRTGLDAAKRRALQYHIISAEAEA